MMTDQTGIRFLFMRGGTSRGPYFKKESLPEDLETLTEVLVHAVGSGHPLNIDGIGGGNPVTTKVAVLSSSDDDWADIDYFFAQVSVEDRQVDVRPTCGNILAGVGPAAIEMGLITPTKTTTLINIRAVNTGARIIAKVQTPDGRVIYSGDTTIDGVPGTGAPIELQFLDVIGKVTGSFFPTGNLIDTIEGIQVTCMDVAMPMMIARAVDFGISGYESASELNDNTALFERVENIRTEAGKRMGLGDVSGSVIPKVGLLAAPRSGGTTCTRYLMPWKCHPSMAVTGSQCLASCVLTPGTIAEGLALLPEDIPARVVLEHPAGELEVIVDYKRGSDGFKLRSAGLIRTARKLAQGSVFIPSRIWRSQQPE